MEISYKKKFLKELAKIPEPYRSNIESFVFNDIHKFESPFQSERIQKLKGHDLFYKVRFGNYRVGLKMDSDDLVFERVLHRKEIYKYYP
jgi:mRNA interferase RelE/StbE